MVGERGLPSYYQKFDKGSNLSDLCGMDREFIISEIQRTANANGGKALGNRRFEMETGIKRHEWYGMYWSKWSDAVKASGLEPNKKQEPLKIDYIILQVIGFIKELGRLPTFGEMRIKKRKEPSFPSNDTIVRRLGNEFDRVEKIAEYCSAVGDLEDVEAICRKVLSRRPEAKISDKDTEESDDHFGYVYLIKSGKYHKIGFSNSPHRREYELNIQLPERAKIVHVISTDDPSGIESYWHKRFKDCHKNGEWFELSQKDVKAFKRRRFM